MDQIEKLEEKSNESTSSNFRSLSASMRNKILKTSGTVFVATKKFILFIKESDKTKKLLKTLPSWRQLTHSYKIFNLLERRLIAVCFAVIITSTIWLGVNQVRANLSFEPVSGGSYTEGLIGQPQFLNPVFASAQAVDTDLTRLIFSGLFKYDTALNLQPDLAEKYEISEDGRIYTVKLKNNLTWHDGEALTVDDVIFTFESITDSDVESPAAQNFRGIAIEKIDDQTIRFSLKDPYNAFLDLLTIGIIPQHIWGNIPETQWKLADYNIRPIGAGPWQFSTLNIGKDGFIKSYTLEKSKSNNNNYIQQLIFKFYPDKDSAETALSTHSIQGLALLSTKGLTDSSFSGNGLEYYDLKLPAVTAIFFNLGQSSSISDIKVRQALKSSLNKKDLVLKSLSGEATLSNGPFPASILPNQHENGSSSEGNKEEAETILNKAGWKLDGNVRKNSKGEVLSITLTIIDRDPDKSVGEFIQSTWRNIGVETKIDLVSPATPTNVRRSLLRPRAYQALLYTIVYGAHPDPYPFWHSSQKVDPGLNLSMFSDNDADTAIEKGRRSLDNIVRTESYQKIHDIVTKEVAAIFLYSPIRRYAISKSIGGIMVDSVATPADRFNGLDQWYVKKKIKIDF